MGQFIKSLVSTILVRFSFTRDPNFMSYKWDTKRFNQADFTDFNELQKSQRRKISRQSPADLKKCIANKYATH